MRMPDGGAGQVAAVLEKRNRLDPFVFPVMEMRSIQVSTT